MGHAGWGASVKEWHGPAGFGWLVSRFHGQSQDRYSGMELARGAGERTRANMTSLDRSQVLDLPFAAVGDTFVFDTENADCRAE